MSERLDKILAVILVWLLTQVAAVAAPPMLTDDEIKALLRDSVEVQKVAPGIVVGFIDERGPRVFSQGKRSQQGAQPVDGDTIFEIGSITKVFTSLLLADMVLRKEVQLDDPISRYLPATVKAPTRNGKEITLLDLATHSSGLPRLPSNISFRDVASENPYARYTVAQMYEFLAGYQLTRDIGAEYEYSNYGAGLLGHLLALKAGTNFEGLVIQRICRPLKMSDTMITLNASLKSRLATGHNNAGKAVSNWDIPTLAGAGALRSSVNDLLKFLGANLGLEKTELQPAMDLQHTPRREIGSKKSQIGLGWHLSQRGPLEMIWHNGGTGGYHSFAAILKETKRGVVVLSNSSRGNEEIGEAVLLGKKPRAKTK